MKFPIPQFYIKSSWPKKLFNIWYGIGMVSYAYINYIIRFRVLCAIELLSLSSI